MKLHQKIGRGLACALVALIASSARAATAEQIEQAIIKGRGYIYKVQTPVGHWENAEHPTGPGDAGKDGHDTEAAQWTGRTAMAVYALLASGEDRNDPRIKVAVDFLAKNETRGVYALGLRCQVWMLMPQTPAYRAALAKDVNMLMIGMKTEGLAKGMYDYIPGKPGGKSYSHSRSQYAVQGFWAAQQAGMEFKDAMWKLIEDSWRRNQATSGGWTYKAPADNTENHPETVGLTAVGVATLFITQDYLRSNEGISCKGNLTNDAIEKGLKWITAHTDGYATGAVGNREYPYPTLYAVERIGAASGLAYFGAVNWFTKGADWAIKEQNPDGSWDQGAFQLTDSCFAMLFLSKGRAPIVISKLKYTDATGKEGKWNQRTRDVANVTKWIGKTLERELAWQIVGLDVPVADLLESPILYISGNEPLNLTPEGKAKLKLYIESGGMILANADCGNAAFTKSIQKLGFELFPDYEFAEFRDSDLIYTNYYPRAKWKNKPSVLRLSNGARPLIVLVQQADLGKAWQLQESRARPELFELTADLLLFSVDNTNFRFRGSRYYIPESGPAPASSINVARLKYNAAWDPEPGGWRRISQVVAKRFGTGVTTTVAELGKGQLGTAKIAHLTGTVTFKLNDTQREELRNFAKAGGTLIIDSCGGSSEFATAAEAELEQIFPGQKPQVLPPEHPLYAAGGAAAEPVTYRQFAIKKMSQGTGPRLQGITIGGRLAVIYSREDLSEGMVGQEIDGVIGYSPTSATNLMARILKFASGG